MPKSTAKKNDKLVEELTYEEALAELEGIVLSLEEEQNPLEEAMKLFERGQALAIRCGAVLDSAQLKIQKITGDSLADFEDDAQ